MSWLYVAAAAVAVVKGVSTYEQGKQTESQYAAASQANEYNAAILRQQADTTREAANAREEQQRRIGRVDEGKRAAAAAQSGLGTGGSNADFERQQSALEEMDALNIRYEGQLQGTELENKANVEDYNSKVNRANSLYAGRSVWLGTASSALSGFMSVYGAGGGGGPK